MSEEYDIDRLEEEKTESEDNFSRPIRAMHEAYQELFQEAEPGFNYARAMIEEGKKKEGQPRYKLNYLDEAEQQRIIEKNVEDLPEYQARKVRATIQLGSAPTAHKEIVNENRKQEGLEPIN